MNILQLLGLQQGVADVAPADQDVVVTANRIGAPTASANPITAVLPAAVTAQRTAPDADVLKEVIPRKGMFGVKGTLRDVLGLVGDSFLTQAGRDQVYRPQRDREKMGDAMSGFTQSEAAAKQAIERLTALGYVDEAAKVQNNLEQQQLRQAQIGSMTDVRNSQIAERKFKGNERFFNIAANMFRGTANDPAKFQAAKNALKNLALNNQIEPVDVLGYDLDELSPEQAMALSRGNINVYQQEQLPFQERRAAVQEGQLEVAKDRAQSQRMSAEASVKRANRPPAGRPASNPTNASIAAPILRKIQSGGTPTKGEAELLNRLGYSADRGQPKKRFGFDPSKIPLPPGFGGIRPVKRN